MVITGIWLFSSPTVQRNPNSSAKKSFTALPEAGDRCLAHGQGDTRNEWKPLPWVRARCKIGRAKSAADKRSVIETEIDEVLVSVANTANQCNSLDRREVCTDTPGGTRVRGTHSYSPGAMQMAARFGLSTHAKSLTTSSSESTTGSFFCRLPKGMCRMVHGFSSVIS